MMVTSREIKKLGSWVTPCPSQESMDPDKEISWDWSESAAPSSMDASCPAASGERVLARPEKASSIPLVTDGMADCAISGSF